MPNNLNDKNLEKVKRVYSFWGKFPSLYNAQDAITFLGKAKTIRSLAVEKMGLKKGDKVGHFQMGSTVIMLLPPNKIQWAKAFQADEPLRFGERIATLL